MIALELLPCKSKKLVERPLLFRCRVTGEISGDSERKLPSTPPMERAPSQTDPVEFAAPRCTVTFKASDFAA
eukprot:CAMPEP_0174718346 /NCGR_PEP_ID=MMETSP1094-20130205/28687_1 /TAXON_ID=156173 /ORGANISM="Chrysochromulina brevifilum, Strain UTEX LB 985" /LENGTH=71 /DNA_ID=CAMNT_0015918429 /DNA_START=1098 /DNA_END=1313 /DNA_ORIENTATION=-